MAKPSGLGSFGMRAPLRRWCVRLVVSMIGAVACTSSPSPTATSSEPVAASSAAGAGAGGSAGVHEKPKAPRPIDSESGEAPSDDCDAAVDGYLARRKALDHCERDSDCAEIWPGLCPHGPYYIHREAEVEAVWAIERRIEEHCEVPKCEPPMKLGIAHCDAGRCRPGREPPPTDEKESCWDYRETHLEAGGTAQARTTSAIRGVTPQLVIAPAHAGRLRLEVEWPRDCTDCTLLVSEHNSGMARLVDTKPATTRETTRNGMLMRRDSIELQVTPGPYPMVGTSDSRPRDFFVHVHLVDESGAPGRVTRHGESWKRLCEG